MRLLPALTVVLPAFSSPEAPTRFPAAGLRRFPQRGTRSAPWKEARASGPARLRAVSAQRDWGAQRGEPLRHAARRRVPESESESEFRPEVLERHRPKASGLYGPKVSGPEVSSCGRLPHRQGGASRWGLRASHPVSPPPVRREIRRLRRAAHPRFASVLLPEVVPFFARGLPPVFPGGKRCGAVRWRCRCRHLPGGSALPRQKDPASGAHAPEPLQPGMPRELSRQRPVLTRGRSAALER